MNKPTDAERDEVLWELAEILYAKMEQFSPEGHAWNEAPADEREFCFHCVSAIIRRPDLIKRFYGWSLADDNSI